jgi:uncharacterized protein involved in oxidation of intracellular sulfur
MSEKGADEARDAGLYKKPPSGRLVTVDDAHSNVWRFVVKALFIISTDDGETIYNALRLANVGVKKGDEVSVFMLGRGVKFEQSGSEAFDVMGQVNQFEGDFYV